ncbi:hypothetical protein [Nocardia testacea]|uniref:hypothetical protein n=1 Tax=Nocardia testacea TaxID=248551 RepID=UPI0002E5106F|nr:hypothetical protein [Nocardia testacea]
MHTPVPRSSELTVARDYLSADYGHATPYYYAEPEEIDEFCAELSPRQVVSRINLIYEGGWAAFCRYHADEIAAADELEHRQWQAEAEEAASSHLFPDLLPAAALRSGGCTLTATESVHGLGGRVADWRRDRMTWAEITEILGVPTPVAMAWAVEGRLRRAASHLTTMKGNPNV